MVIRGGGGAGSGGKIQWFVRWTNLGSGVQRSEIAPMALGLDVGRAKTQCMVAMWSISSMKITI